MKTTDTMSLVNGHRTIRHVFDFQFKKSKDLVHASISSNDGNDLSYRVKISQVHVPITEQYIPVLIMQNLFKCNANKKGQSA